MFQLVYVEPEKIEQLNPDPRNIDPSDIIQSLEEAGGALYDVHCQHDLGVDRDEFIQAYVERFL